MLARNTATPPAGTTWLLVTNLFHAQINLAIGIVAAIAAHIGA